jgi:hypothetical protein
MNTNLSKCIIIRVSFFIMNDNPYHALQLGFFSSLVPIQKSRISG